MTEHYRQRIAIEACVDIRDDDDVASAGTKAQVDTRALAAPMPQPDHLVDQSFGPQVVRDILHPVGGAVIYDDYFQTAPIAKSMLDQASDTGAQRWSLIVSDQDNAKPEVGLGRLPRALRKGRNTDGDSTYYITRDFEQRGVPEQENKAHCIERTQKCHRIH